MAKEKLLDNNEKLRILEKRRQEIIRDVKVLEEELDNIRNEIQTLWVRFNASPIELLTRFFRQKSHYIFYLILIFFGGPPTWKAIRYYILAPWAEKAKPLNLQFPAQWRIPVDEDIPPLKIFPAAKSIAVQVENDAPLVLREGYLNTRKNTISRTSVMSTIKCRIKTL